MIDQETWDEAFAGFHVYDCAVRHRDAFSFICIERMDGEHHDGDVEPNKRLVTIFPELGDIDYDEYSGFALPLLAMARQPLEQAVMVSMAGEVAVLGSGEQDLEANIPFGSPDTALFASAEALATIDGDVYAVGNWRGVARRTRQGQWESVAKRDSLPVPAVLKNGRNYQGFKAIDGFNARDIYCGGGQSDLWRFDGARWHHCPVPTTMYVESICCAGDGYVYVGLQSGSLMRGRENHWKVIHNGDMALPFKDLVWFNGKVWGTSDYGVWTIVDGAICEAPVPASARACAGNLSVADGVMLLAGMYGAAVFDGARWKRLGPGI